MARRRTYGIAAAAAAGAVLVATPSSAMTAPEGSTGANTAVPTAQDAQLDISKYDIDLAYQRAAGAITGTSTLTATAPSALKSFTLDFARTPTAATVNGEPVRVEENGDQTVITLSHTVPQGETLTIVITYELAPSVSEAGSRFPAAAAPDGEADAAESGIPAAWFPHNVRPDAATFDLTTALPAFLQAARTADGMKYLDRAAVRAAAAGAAREAAQDRAREAAAERRATAADTHAERRAAWLAARAERRAEWRTARAENRDGWRAERLDRDRGDRWDNRGDRDDDRRGRGEGRGEGHHRGHHGHGDRDR